ncbi:MAG: hypothetical protein K2I03_09105 [Lachnospiraceae bacterium]|nr:hypothetical protein [Lachnospiraceae bacterium]MDE6251751.1 hypothetical protein [Lachnospiraceae bacterium]
MFYEIRDDVADEVQFEDIQEDSISAGCMSMDELLDLYQQYKLDRQVIEECYADKSHFRTGVDIYEDYAFGVIDIVKQQNVLGNRDKIAFIIRKNQFLLINISGDNENLEVILENGIHRFKQNITLEKIVFSVFDSFVSGGNAFLENTEKRIMEMEKNIVERQVNELLNKEIYDMRNRLSVMRSYYEQLVEIGEELLENENGIFASRELRYFKIYKDKVSRLSENTMALSESLIHLREALDAALNYSINNTMKMFTVVTTVFLPLTLVAGWYGMNFEGMPELKWEYGYEAVIGVSIVVVILCIIFFKKKKLI